MDTQTQFRRSSFKIQILVIVGQTSLLCILMQISVKIMFSGFFFCNYYFESQQPKLIQGETSLPPQKGINIKTMDYFGHKTWSRCCGKECLDKLLRRSANCYDRQSTKIDTALKTYSKRCLGTRICAHFMVPPESRYYRDGDLNCTTFLLEYENNVSLEYTQK